MNTFKIHLTVLIFILATLSVNSQTQDLYEFASGELVTAVYLFDEKEELFGYFYLYDEGETEKRTHRYRYIILDKNLNKIASNDYEQMLPKPMKHSYQSIVKMGDSVFIHSVMDRHEDAWTPKATIVRIIDLTKNLIGPEYIATGRKLNSLKMGFDEYFDEEERTSYEDLHTIPFKSSMAYLLIAGQGKFGYKGFESITILDMNYKEIWSTRILPMNDYKKSFIDNYVIDKNTIVFALAQSSSNIYGPHLMDYKIIGLNIGTGDLLFEYPLNEISNGIVHNFDLSIEQGHIYITGSYSSKHKDPRHRFIVDFKDGLFIRVLDLSGHEIANNYMNWASTSPYLDFGNSRRIDGKFYIKYLDFITIKDGTSAIISEKSPREINPNSSGSTDLVYFLYDKNFTLTNVEIIEKHETKKNSSDYLYSQYFDDHSGANFFYSDYRKSKIKGKSHERILGINTVRNGQLTTEEIPMTSGDHVIIPMRAKEGFILFREINKNENTDILRLERLNN